MDGTLPPDDILKLHYFSEHIALAKRALAS
jgi:hypothetical protein